MDQKGQALEAQLRQLEAQVDRQTELARVGLSMEAFCRFCQGSRQPGSPELG